MKTIFAITAATLTFGTVSLDAQETLYNPTEQFAQASQWYIAPNGCSYSRSQAPGQPVMWMLIRNPHHIGGRNATSACSSMLRG